jgi:hypothetical protein
MAADLADITGLSTPAGLLIGGQWTPGGAGPLLLEFTETKYIAADW